ncbi:hypothetical protein K1719_001115 [Acacia pycnantha]|nr:hypothetical protein K1719_001115 [Acacia pycnantha]
MQSYVDYILSLSAAIDDHHSLLHFWCSCKHIPLHYSCTRHGDSYPFVHARARIVQEKSSVNQLLCCNHDLVEIGGIIS